MHYVIIRDDDTNALTPVECLERLYRPFLERGLPVNLAVIPNVATDTRMPDGGLEGYLAAGSCPELRGVPPQPSPLPQGEGTDVELRSSSRLPSGSSPSPPLQERVGERRPLCRDSLNSMAV